MPTDTNGIGPIQHVRTSEQSRSSRVPASISDLPVGVVTFADIGKLERSSVETHKQQLQTETEYFALPEGYGDNHIVLLVRDPRCLYAYWEITQDKREELQQKLGIDIWQQSKLILRVEDVTDLATGGNSVNYFDIEIDNHAMSWYVHVPEANRSYRVNLGFLTHHREFYTLARSNIVTTPRDGISEIIDEQWMIVEEEFKRLYKLAAGCFTGDSSVGIAEAIMKRQQLEMGSGAMGAVSSPVFFEDNVRPFWLAAKTELVVYGSTEPNARVTIQGNPIELRPDGSFTARFALPEGRHEIHIQAISHDSTQERTITPVVNRETRN
jgi:hypothetical protein